MTALHTRHGLVYREIFPLKMIQSTTHVYVRNIIIMYEANLIEETEAHYKMSNTEGTKDLRWKEGKEGWREGGRKKGKSESVGEKLEGVAYGQAHLEHRQ